MALDDIEAVHELIYAAHHDTYVNEALGVTSDKLDEYLMRSTAEGRRANAERRIVSLNHQAWTAKDVNQNVIGMAASYIQEDGTRLLGALYVAKEWHGTGLAHDLITTVIDWLGGERYDIELRVVSYNERAKAFYRRHGFQEVSGSDDFFNELVPDVAMIRRAMI